MSAGVADIQIFYGNILLTIEQLDCMQINTNLDFFKALSRISLAPPHIDMPVGRMEEITVVLKFFYTSEFFDANQLTIVPYQEPRIPVIDTLTTIDVKNIRGFPMQFSSIP